MSIQRRLISIVGAALLVALCASGVYSSPPHPDLQARIKSGEIEPPPFLKNLEENHKKGICTGSAHNAAAHTLAQARFFKAADDPNYTPAAVTFKALALLVDFSDKISVVNANFFDTLLFENSVGTVRDYYSEISYGQLDLVSVNLPSSLGWNRAPQTYAYYVNGQNGTGSYPQNSQKLTEDIVDQIDGAVDFSQYDNDADGYVDVLILIHAGSGAEFTSNANDIWSHKWAITPRLKDGVYIFDYTIQPEYWLSAGDMSIGVYAHELGHGFGLPDLYDTDYSSWGIGRWSLMASGSWNGPGNMGDFPAHPDAWSRIQMNMATATNITANSTGSQIPNVEGSASIFRLWTGGGASSEYYLMENRRKVGYDAYLPGQGLLIWHIDDGATSNDNEWYPGNTGSGHFKVALEQADGLWNIDKKVDAGSVGDAFSSSTAADFSPLTTPSSDGYNGATTFVAVNNVSASADTMTADLTVSLAAGTDPDTDAALPNSLAVAQNYPNPFNPSTTIQFSLPKVTNVTVTVYNVLGEVVTVVMEGSLNAGDHYLVWDGKNDAGSSVASGIYIYEVTTDQERDARTMTLLK